MAREIPTATMMQSRRHWQSTLMLAILLLMMTLLLDGSLGQLMCGQGELCPHGNCCGYNGICGNTSAFCGVGNCSSQCPSSSGRCGPYYGYALCNELDGSCCSTDSWCGVGVAWCSADGCAEQCPNGTCGVNGGTCAPGLCCSTSGFCGNNPGYCSPEYCASQCPPVPPSSPPSPPPSPGPIFPIGGGDQLQKSRPGSKVGIVVGSAVGAVCILLGCVSIALLMWKRSKLGKNEPAPTEDSALGGSPIFVEGMPAKFTYKQLSMATEGFSEDSMLGQGGFGSVYSGVLPTSGIPVAVKKINSESSQGEKEFLAEVSIISQLRHRNLIQLQGWCTDHSAKEKLYLLVYELMPNGSLDKALFGPAQSGTVCLSWSQRFNILTGAAAAVEYLHQGWKQQVIHRDIKSSNIMLDEGWNAKLGDFGLARFVDHHRTAATTVVAGTYGYLAPEAVSSGRFTEKTDVYAFGAVALEIACGRKALSFELPPPEVAIVDWVWGRLGEGDLLSTVDPRLADYDEYWMKVVLMVGLLCSHPDPLARPSMRRIVEILDGDVQVPAIPASKPAPIYSSSSDEVFIHGPKRHQKTGRTSKSRLQEPGTSTFTLGDTAGTSDYTPDYTIASGTTKGTASSSSKDTVSSNSNSSLISRAC